MIRRKVLILAVLAATAVAFAGETYTLEKCLGLASERNLDIKQKKLDLEKFEKKVGQAYASVFPHISIVSGAAYVLKPDSMTITMADPSTGFDKSFDIAYPDFGFAHTLDVTQVLFSAQAFMGIKIARTQKQVEELNNEITRRAVKSSVEKAFYNILITQKAADIMEASFKQDTLHLSVAREKFAKGIVSEFEVLRSEVKVKNSKSDLENARLGNRMSKVFIFMILDLPYDSTAVFMGEFSKPIELTTLDKAIELANTNRPELLAIEGSLKVLKNVYRAYEAAYFPNIAAQATFSNVYGSDEIGDIFALDDFIQDWTIGVGLQWTLFDGFNRSQKVGEAKRDYEKLKLTAEQVKLGIDAEIHQKFWQLEQYRTDYSSALASIEQAQKMLDIANVQFKEGLITFVELNDAQLAFDATQLRYHQALYNYNIALSDYNRAVGK
jgi:outer membrane protein